jgi:hypothetical protein|nr:MAG TPA: hypothetical protein [Caudoviricetes sp.]
MICSINGTRVAIKADLARLKSTVNLPVTVNTGLTSIEAGATAWIGKKPESDRGLEPAVFRREVQENLRGDTSDS